MEKEESTLPAKGDWVRYLIKGLFKNRGFYDYPMDLVYFWILNYDRSLEFIIFQTLRAMFPGSRDRGPTDVELLQRINRSCEHLHGALGKFAINGEHGRPFSPDLPPGEEFSAIAEGITLIYEKSNLPQPFSIRNAILEKNPRIVFLGFGYHTAILDRFRPGIINKHVIGTAWDLNDHQRKKIFTYLEPGIGVFDEELNFSLPTHGRITLGPSECDCLGLLSQYLG